MNTAIISRNTKHYLLVKSDAKLETTEDLLQHCKALYGEALNHGAKKLLIDEPNAQFPTEIFPYFDLVKSYVDNFPPELRSIKVAVVLAEKYQEIGASWEALCTSRGFQFAAFTSFDKATAWLESQ